MNQLVQTFLVNPELAFQNAKEGDKFGQLTLYKKKDNELVIGMEDQHLDFFVSLTLCPVPQDERLESNRDRKNRKRFPPQQPIEKKDPSLALSFPITTSASPSPPISKATRDTIPQSYSKYSFINLSSLSC